MHYLTYVFIPADTDIETAVAEAMRPFGDGFEVKPWKKYLDEGEIAAMAKNYRVKRTALRKLAAKMEDWSGAMFGGLDERGLFAVMAYNRDAKWDWYEIGGRWNRFLPDNSATCRSLRQNPKLEDLLPHDFLTPDGEWHAKTRYVSTGWCAGHFVHRSLGRWIEEFRTALAAYPDHLVVCVDRHF